MEYCYSITEGVIYYVALTALKPVWELQKGKLI